MKQLEYVIKLKTKINKFHQVKSFGDSERK